MYRHRPALYKQVLFLSFVKIFKRKMKKIIRRKKNQKADFVKYYVKSFYLEGKKKNKNI